MIEQYGRVRVLTDRAHIDGVPAGSIGYVIECYPDGAHEVDVSNLDGITIGQAVLAPSELELAETDL